MIRRRLAMTLLVLAAALGACQKKPQKAEPAPPSLTWTRTTPDATVRLTLAPAIRQQDPLRQKLFDDGVREMTNFLAHAKQDRERLTAKGIAMAPYERTVSWTVTGQNPALVGAWQTWFEYTGGAHPNHGSDGLIWSVREARALEPSELFRPDADQGRLDQVLCDAVKAAKTARNGPAAADPTWSCPKWADSDFVLAPSTVAGRFGGLTFLFDPYAIGPYSDGDYAVTVPLASFSDALAPAYAPEFAGEPRPQPQDPAAPKGTAQKG